MLSTRTQKLWRQIALSQLDRRRLSESENVSLREMVHIQILEAKNLRRILKRRSRIEVCGPSCSFILTLPNLALLQSMEEAFGVKGIKALKKRTSTDNHHTFERLLLESDVLFVGMDDLFGAKGMDNLPFTGHVRETNLDIVDGVYYEMLQRRMLPFDIHTTETAVWECLRHVAMDNLREVGSSNGRVNVHPYTTEEEGDTLRSSFFAVMSGVGDLAGTFNTKVVRRYRGEDKITFVFRVISEPKFERGRQGISATTTMQIVLNTVDTGDEDATTMMKVYFTAERSTLAAREDPATPMAFAAWDKLVPRFPIDVESILLDGKRNTSALAGQDTNSEQLCT
ncbi:hypothetical protein PHMEG_0005413 [Phytophthora megakarya]|uniref:Uncharacterized protein n=1 Tax=Phytophthora megakarya TaxID=4795 RepID=A0A225WTE6_9STRA|nr:hypothetical protein PHMEG_0005413 [Phytophthora megakarya]